jgi:hypothetical protein
LSAAKAQKTTQKAPMKTMTTMTSPLTVTSALNNILQPLNIVQQAKYCSQCGQPAGQCNCCQPSTTVCITFDTSILQSLVNMLPKVQITNNTCCNNCGHQSHTGECPNPDCDCGC